MIIESYSYPEAVAGLGLRNEELASFAEVCCNARRHASRGFADRGTDEDKYLRLAIRRCGLSLPVLIDRIGAALQPTEGEFGLIRARVCDVMGVRLVHPEATREAAA